MTFQRPALDLLADLRRGKLNRELTEALHDLVAACVDTGKKGELVLKLTVTPDKDDFTTMFEVTDQWSVKTPARTTKPSRFFLTDDGNLTRSDPNQETFAGMRDVSAPTANDLTAKAN